MLSRRWIAVVVAVGLVAACAPDGSRRAPFRPWELRRMSAPSATRMDLDVSCELSEGCPEAVGLWARPDGDPDGDEPYRCTAALIGPDRVLTAGHCLPPDARVPGASCAGAFVGFVSRSGDRGTEWLECRDVVSVVAGPEPGDALHYDRAIVRLRSATVRRPLPLAPRPLVEGEIVTVASVTPDRVYASQHRVRARLCRVETPPEAIEMLGPLAISVDWLSSCPIYPGNSGSPVLSRAGAVIAVVHGGTDPELELGVVTPIESAR